MNSTATTLKTIRPIGAVLMTAMLSLLTACSGGSGGGTSGNPAPVTNADGSAAFVYSGAAPTTLDMQRFKIAFYDNVVNHCGDCHTSGGQGKTPFVDHGNISTAYQNALTLIDRQNPANSPIVAKVYGGHNCWEASNAACRVQMTEFIKNWVSTGNGDATSVTLASPNDRNPNGANGQGFKSFPSSAAAAGFVGGAQPPSLYGLLTKYCSRCHSDTATAPQQPYFASADPLIAYEAVKSKIDLNDPALSNPNLKAKSRLVVRLRDEFHNCWTANCAQDAADMQAAIKLLADSITATQLASGVYRSMAQTLNDGIVGSSGGRFETYQIALWSFLEGEGNVVSDTSGVAPAISLSITGVEGETGDFKWVGGGGIQFASSKAAGTAAASKKLYDQIAVGGEYSVEAWVAPANTTDQDRDIVAYGDGGNNRNFLLGQYKDSYKFLNRSSASNARAELPGQKDPNNKALQATLQHVVVTYDPINGRKLYVDGQLTTDNQPADHGTLVNDWDKTFRVILGSDVAGSAWKGALRMVAVHKRALTEQQIAQNALVRPGEKRYVMFNVSNISGMPATCIVGGISYCYVYFEVSQYDNYAYLFYKPYFISLNPDTSGLNGLTIQGIHIGMNGKLASVGQAYVNVNTTINTASAYHNTDNTPGSGQLLLPSNTVNTVGTVVPKSAGPDGDLFYLEFDQIGSNAPNPVAPPVVLSLLPPVLDGVATFDIGWRTFDEINASFSQLTGVPVTAPTAAPSDSQGAVTVSRVFNGVRSQLPAVEDFPAYLSSHQTSVTQLAIAYCSALMKDSGYRQAFFGAGASAPNYLPGNGWDNLINPLVDKFLSGGGLYPSSPTLSSKAHTELLELLTHSAADTSRKPGICSAGGSCSSDAAILNAATVTCAAALANAAITLQ